MLAEKKTIDRFLFESDIIVDEAFSKLSSAINNYELWAERKMDMKKKVISIFLAQIFVIGILPMAYASATGEFSDYQQGVLEYCNKYHNGSNLVLDARNQRSGRHDNRSE